MNPVLHTYIFPPDTLPSYSKIKPEHVEPAIDFLLSNSEPHIDLICQNAHPPTWRNLIAIVPASLFCFLIIVSVSSGILYCKKNYVRDT